MIFLDTSAILALANRTDKYYEVARKALEHIRSSGDTLLTHNYTIVESAALMQKRFGKAAASKFLREAGKFTLRWVSPEQHEEAVREFESRGSAKVSFVDVVSFIVMRAEGISGYLGFDEHFTAAGFEPVRGGE